MNMDHWQLEEAANAAAEAALDAADAESALETAEPVPLSKERIDEIVRYATKPNLDALAKEIRTVNAANGWNVTQPEEWADRYKFAAILALIHSELTEADRGWRDGDRANFLEELADVAIRVLDCVGCWESQDFDGVVRERMFPGRRLLSPLEIQAIVSDALEAFRHDLRDLFLDRLADVFVQVERLCKFHGGDLHAEIECKVAKNRERGHRHGGKKL